MSNSNLVPQDATPSNSNLVPRYESGGGGGGGGITNVTNSDGRLVVTGTAIKDINFSETQVTEINSKAGYGITQLAADYTLQETDQPILQFNAAGVLTLPATAGFVVGKRYTILNNTIYSTITINPITGLNNGNTNPFYIPGFSFGSLNYATIYHDGIDVNWFTVGISKGCLARQNIISIPSLGDGEAITQNITLSPAFGTVVLSAYIAKVTNTQNAFLLIQLIASTLTGSSWVITNLSNQIVTNISIAIQTEGY